MIIKFSPSHAPPCQTCDSGLKATYGVYKGAVLSVAHCIICVPQPIKNELETRIKLRRRQATKLYVVPTYEPREEYA